MFKRAILALFGFGLTCSAQAEPAIITSAKPDSISVSIYRDPERSQHDLQEQDPLDLEELQGFAMIQEKRIVDLPAGEAVIRFEGVASGLNPKSVIVVADGVGERNQDRRLISQRGLIDAFTGQRVMLRRFNKATGKTTTESATIRSTPDRLVVQTKDGIEALQCSGLRETLLFPNVPATLTAKPTLSVLLNGKQAAGRQTVTLIYLATNFDWQAHYLGEIAADGQTLELTGLMTMASADETSFPNAETGAIAGTVLKAQPRRIEHEDGEYDYEEEEERDQAENPYSADNIDLDYSCWPYGTTGARPNYGAAAIGALPPPIKLSLRRAEEADALGEIIVTANRVEARLEDVGDLKFYRIPFPTTVAVNSQKSVAFLYRPEVKGELLYVHRYEGDDDEGTYKVIRLKNRKEFGLGVPLPGGSVKLFQGQGGKRALIFDAGIKDKTQSEDVDLEIDDYSSDVDVEFDDVKESKNYDDEGKGWKLVEVKVENWEEERRATVEIEFRAQGEYRHGAFTVPLEKRDGMQVWRAVLKPEEKRSFRFKVFSNVPKQDDGE